MILFHQEISVPPEDNQCSLEVLHDGVHTWVGGDMGDLGLSAFDPVFYFHHAFIDYVWELFRRNQVMRWVMEPASVSPPASKPDATWVLLILQFQKA